VHFGEKRSSPFLPLAFSLPPFLASFLLTCMQSFALLIVL
jgi:hypothetical protein